MLWESCLLGLCLLLGGALVWNCNPWRRRLSAAERACQLAEAQSQAWKEVYRQQRAAQERAALDGRWPLPKLPDDLDLHFQEYPCHS